MRKDLKFGVEIEVATSKSRREILEALRNAGIDAVGDSYGSSVNPTAWKVQPDGSLGKGWEIVSPPLNNFEELEKVVHVLRKDLKVRCNKKTGLHVHHDINDLSLSQIKNLFRLYDKYESTVLKTILDPKRFKADSYCRPIGGYYLDRLEEVETTDQFKRIYPDRYYSLNSKAYIKYGTIEFRQHQGTIHYNEIEAWIKLTHKMIELAMDEKQVRNMISETKEDQLVEMIQELQVEDEAILKHYKKAQKYVSKMAI